SGLLLPWMTLAFLHAAQYARQTRAGMLETMGEDYIRTARAKGLKESRVILKHGLRPTLTPILTIFGLDIGLVLGGAVLTEQVYSLNGIGRFAVTAIVQSDLPVILGVTLFGAFFIVLCNLAVVLLYSRIDPRVRTSRCPRPWRTALPATAVVSQARRAGNGHSGNRKPRQWSSLCLRARPFHHLRH